MRANHRRKKTISLKMFITEFGENFSEHMKEKLMGLEQRCFLTRKEISYRLDLKHVEHVQYECACDVDGEAKICHKEYAYGQFVVIDGVLYFSESCFENNDIKQSPMVSIIYNSLGSEGMINDEGINLKKIDDSNVDYVVDSILSGCPMVSQKYMEIMSHVNKK